ncbi:hypothetical protein NBRC116592_15250 [Colwellia sp. KU-HH00111]|uniref:hypothetical protein n=1 Tax=Colwellia sp. KU-HH00111 TaxID=3127652 RepID=UPI003106FB2E
MLIRALLISIFLISVNAVAEEEKEYICGGASEKLASVIEDWYDFIQGAESKNASIINLYSDFKEGKLKPKVVRHCSENWSVFSDIYSCFSGIRSELGAAMCLHPDTNKNGWSYW